MKQYLFLIFVFLLGAIVGTIAAYLGSTDILISLNKDNTAQGDLIQNLPPQLTPYSYKITKAPLITGRYFSYTDTIIIYNGYFQDDTIRHEIGHRLYQKTLNNTIKKQIKQIYQNTTNFITPHASKNPEENFCENIACYYTPKCQPSIEPQMLQLINQINQTLSQEQ